MMLAALLHEVRRRRLWPIPLVALLVAIAAPLLFLKSSPPAAPDAVVAASTAPPAGKLPSRAKRLLAASDDAATQARRSRKPSDPFQEPSSRRSSSSAGASSKAADAAEAAGTVATGTSASDAAPAGAAVGTTAIPVIITNPGAATPASTGQPIGDGSAVTSSSPSTRSVDVRYGENMPAPLYRGIPRLQTFLAGGRVIAIFVKYSPSRDKAVFAIGPDTLVSGEIECRRKEGVCRYVDIPAGRGVRLTTAASDGSAVSRRLDVERIQPRSQTGATAAASTAPANGSCLLAKLLALSADDPPLASDACQS